MGFWSRLFGKKEEVTKDVCPNCGKSPCECPVEEVKEVVTPQVVSSAVSVEKTKAKSKAPTKKAAPKTKATTAKGKPAPKGVETEPVVVNKPPRATKDIVVTESDLGKMSKKDLDEFAESLGIKLDRRERKGTMVDSFMKQWHAMKK